MLQNWASSGSRYARRTVLVLLAWGLFMITTIQFRHTELSDGFGTKSASSIDELYSLLGNRQNLAASSSYLVLEQQILHSVSVPASVPLMDVTIDRLTRELPEPLLDHRPVKTEEELIDEIERQLPSLPLAYWVRSSKLASEKIAKNTGCIIRYPSIFDLEFNNIYWQTLRSSNGTFQLFGAFYDERQLSRIGPAIRIVGMINRIEPSVKSFCQMWFEGQREPCIVEVLEYKYVWYSKWGNYKHGIYQPYVIACKVPQSHWRRGPPVSVSLVERRCDTASNNVRVIYNKPLHKKQFAVCVKGLDFLHEDLSVRLIEWIELINLLGADKIFFYQLQIHPNVSKVLKYYEDLDRVHVTPLTLPGGQPNVPSFQHMYLTKKTNHKRQNELIPYNDCLYKHMYEYEYIALLDVDEVIMPVQDATWQELMYRVMKKALKVRNETRASYNVRNVYFLDDLLHSRGSFKDIPRYMHMLQHVYRSRNFTKPNQYIKCFHNPERVVTLHNHFPLACLGAGCTSYPLDIQDAQLQHYRADCVKSLKKKCIEYRENSVLDTTIWRYRQELVDRVTGTLKILGFLMKER